MNKFITKVTTTGAAMATGMQVAAMNAMVFAQGPLSGESVEPGKGFAQDISNVINSVLSFVMLIAGLLVLLYLIWGGIEWITSGGDKGKTESARNKITAAVIGLIVLAASYAIFLLIINFIGFGDSGDLFDNVQYLNAP